MKVLILFCLFGVLMFFDCSNKNQVEDNNQRNSENKMQDLFTYKNKIGDVEYTFTAKLIEKSDSENDESDTIQVEYSVKNYGKKNYLLYNQGHYGTKENLVYVEPQKNGVVEISQRAFREPEDRNCPYRYFPITPNASWLKAGKTINNEISVNLPLELKTPFDDCKPLPEMPEKISKIKFCLGISEADKSKVKLDKNRIVEGWQNVKEQQLLCSETIELK